MRNPSLHFISQSKVKTFTSIDENASVIQYQPQNEPQNEEEFSKLVENNQIKKWFVKKQNIPLPYIGVAEDDKAKSNSFYLLRIDEICDIAYKKNQNSQKIYLEINCNLFDHQNDSYCARTVSYNLFELEHQTATHSHYRFVQPLNLYFYTKSTSNMSIKIDLTINESSELNGQQIIQFRTYLGELSVDPFKGIKSKQKGNFISKKNQLALQAVAQFSVSVSDSFKILEKLIPPNCLCTPEDLIGGLSGRRLPNVQINMIHQLDYTELHSFRSDVSNIEIYDNVIQQAIKTTEMMHKFLTNAQTVAGNLKEMRLYAYFHNGWTTVHETSLVMKEKMEIHKKMSTSKNKTLVKYRNYVCEEVFMLPFIFMDEEAVVIFQVVGRIQVKSKRPKQAEQTNFVQMPICYCFYVIDKQLSDNKNIRTFSQGNALGSQFQNCVQVSQDKNQIQTKKSVNESNMLGKITFYVQLDSVNKMQFSKQNISMVNKSIVEVDKVMMEKQRMIRQNKKLKLENRKKKIQLNQQIPVLDTTDFKNSLFADEMERLREERREKEELARFLVNKLKQMGYDDEQQKISEAESHDIVQREGQNYIEKYVENNIFYESSLSRDENERDAENDSIMIPPLWVAKDPRISLSGEVTMDIIKTELLEQNYSYAFFINWLNLVPISQSVLIPRKFYFKVKFFNSDMIESPICQVQPSTGQIQLCNEEQKTKKIIFFEYPPMPDIQNHTSKFMQFIGYLFHSDFQIKIIDYYSKMEFGQCFYKLKDLIRMRRNDVVVMRDLLVKNGEKMKGKLKVEVKCLKKENERKTMIKNEENITKIEQVSLPVEIRQQKRIEKYKKMKKQGGKEESQSQKIQKLLTQNFNLGEIKVNVNRMKGQFIWLQLLNKQNYVEEYRITVNDPDKGYIMNDELILVTDNEWHKISQMRWWKYLTAVGQEKQKLNLFRTLTNKGTIQVEPGKGVNLLLFYYSDRKYEGEYFEIETQKQLNQRLEPKDVFRVYNHERCINVTVTNQSSKALIGIYKINIVPQPEYNNLEFVYSRKTDEKIQVCIPFDSQSDFNMYIDDPTVIATTSKEDKMAIIDCFPGTIEHPKKFQASICSPEPQKRLLLTYSFTFWGAQQIFLEGQLWQPVELLLDFHSSYCKKAQITHIVAVSEDEKMISIRDKNPIKINTKQSKTLIRAKFTGREYGTKFYQVNLVHPQTYKPIYRYVIKSCIAEPQITESMTLKLRITDKLIEEPFSFKNEHGRKLKLSTFSTKQYLLWCTVDSFEVDPKAEKKIRIKINAELVMEREVVILCLRGEKASYFYRFILELTDLF